jgi:type IV secretory pathway TrbF-like protein
MESDQPEDEGLPLSRAQTGTGQPEIREERNLVPGGEAKESAGRGIPGAVKEWSEAVSTLMKALLLLMAFVTVAVIAGTSLWREYRQKSIAITVEPDAEKLLVDLGSDLDLCSLLVQEVNTTVTAFTEIVRSFAGDQILARDVPESLSQALRPGIVD